MQRYDIQLARSIYVLKSLNKIVLNQLTSHQLYFDHAARTDQSVCFAIIVFCS